MFFFLKWLEVLQIMLIACHKYLKPLQKKKQSLFVLLIEKVSERKNVLKFGHAQILKMILHEVLFFGYFF